MVLIAKNVHCLSADGIIDLLLAKKLFNCRSDFVKETTCPIATQSSNLSVIFLATLQNLLYVAKYYLVCPFMDPITE